MLVVQKYGGATLATPEKIKSVAEKIALLKKSGVDVVVVVSAMGQTTNQLIELSQKVSKNPSLREMDMLMSVGERISMSLLSMALNDLRCEAISFTGSQAGILTDDDHINASIVDVKPFRVNEALAKNKVVVLAGFQGVSEKTKEITTLGRGGSDITAIAMALALNADRCEILKDIECVMSADPSQIPNANSIRHLSFDVFFEMTFWGAKVLNYRAIELILKRNSSERKKFELYVGPANDLESIKPKGTIVHDLESEKKMLFDKKFQHSVVSVNRLKEVWQLNSSELKTRVLENQKITDLPFNALQVLKTLDSNFVLVTAPEEILLRLKQHTKIVSNFSSVTITTNDSALIANTENQIKKLELEYKLMQKSDFSIHLFFEPQKATEALAKIHQHFFS